jgi:hypothetical protein
MRSREIQLRSSAKPVYSNTEERWARIIGKDDMWLPRPVLIQQRGKLPKT